MPRVSIITPLYNAQAFIEDTIKTVVAQSFTDWEYTIVDDGSKDGSPDIVRRYAASDPRIKLIVQPNGHVCNARNNGFAASHPASQYLLFLDHDDVLESNFLERMTAYLDANPNIGLVYTSMKVIDGKGVVQPETDWIHPRRYERRGLGYTVVPDTIPATSINSFMAYFQSVPSCCLFRRSTYELAGGWDEETGRMVYEDKDLVMRCSLIAPVHMLNEYLVRYRWHESNASHNDNPGFREHFEGRWLHGTFMTPAQRKKARRGIAFNRYMAGALAFEGAKSALRERNIGQALKQTARAAFRIAQSPLALIGR